MSETCAVCKKGQGPEKCEVCGFSDNGFINRNFLSPEETKKWIETVVKPYRVYWEARKREDDLLAQLEKSKKREAELSNILVPYQISIREAKERETELLAQLEKAKKRETELLAELEKVKKREAELLAQLEKAKSLEYEGVFSKIGDIFSKSTSAQPNSFTDPRDKRTYKIVKIGNQIWMAENLNYDAKGSKHYNNSSQNGVIYGRLYDWDTAKSACPSGWHLPSKEEWSTLASFAGEIGSAGLKLKATNGWNKNEQLNSGNGLDSFGFAALPGGCRKPDGNFINAGYCGYWWSDSNHNTTSAYGLKMDNDREYVDFSNYHKHHLFSVRCVKNRA